MDCPRCKVELNVDSVQNHVGYSCGHCHGLWLSGKFLDSLTELRGFDKAFFFEKLEETKQDHRPMVCPGCSESLTVSLVDTIEIDWCDACVGIWFDRGELDKLVKGRGKIMGAGKFQSLLDVLTLFR